MFISRRPKKWSSFKKVEIKKRDFQYCLAHNGAQIKTNVLIGGKVRDFVQLALSSTFEFQTVLKYCNQNFSSKKRVSHTLV